MRDAVVGGLLTLTALQGSLPVDVDLEPLTTSAATVPLVQLKGPPGCRSGPSPANAVESWEFSGVVGTVTD